MMMGGGDARRFFGGDTSKPKKVSATLRRFGEYFAKYWARVLLVLILVLASVYTQVISPELVGQAVDCYFIPTPNCWYDQLPAGASTAARIQGLTGLVALLLGLYILGGVLDGASFYMMRLTGENVLRAIRTDLFRKIHQLSLGYYARSEAGNVMSRLTSDTDTIQQVFSFALIRVVSGVILIVSVMAQMLRANVGYALISLTIVPLMIFATSYFSSQARRAFRRTRKEMGSVNADLQEKIAGAREVQAFNNEEESIRQFRQTNAANRDANVKAAAYTSALAPSLEALGYVAIAIVVLYGGLSVLRGAPLLGGAAISLGTIIAFIQYVLNFNRPIQQISILWTNVQSAVAGGERIFELIDTPVEIEDRPGAKPMPQIQGKVEFVDVRAEYKAGEPVLKGVNFTAEPGQTVAIVGPTGAGKTTIINLIPRFYDVTGGAVKIDGHDVREVTLDSLRSQIGLVLQDSFLFSTTVMDNIRYGRLDATDEDVIAAAKMVGADSFIERLAEGYQTVLGERGAGLSQGQRQLIAIARAALMQPRILILDEATSSVDTRTERIIQTAFEKMLSGRTSFVIAHRLSTIRNADVVLMLKAGEIIERGTHNELLARQGEYYQLYMSQFRREAEQESEPAEPVAGD
ncbi:MAG: ABC transporter ATP-binding protein [bacterium]|nr:ABC transporter ATP-binding protein [bacterium]